MRFPARRHDVILVAIENRFGVARLPLILNRAGCRITVLGNPRALVCWSRFVDRVIPCEPNPSDLIAALRRLLVERRGGKPWVIFTDEKTLEIAATCRREPWLANLFAVDPAGPMADIILRKTSFMAAAADAGLPIPAMRICSTLDQAQGAGSELRFPLFFKRDVDCAGAGVTQVFGPGEIADAYRNLRPSGPVLVQEMIPGPLAKANMLYMHGKPMCWTSAYALKTWPGKFGPSCVRQSMVDPQIEAIVHRLGDFTGFHGLCGFDVIRDSRTGRFTVIEFNGRLTPHYHLGQHVGVDYARAMADFLAGRFSEQRPRIFGRKAPRIHIFPQDIRRCITDRDWVGFLQWLPGVGMKDIPWADANVALYFILDLMKLIGLRAGRWFKLRRVLITRRQAQSVQVGLSRSEVIRRLGRPLREQGGDERTLVYRLFDGQVLRITMSDGTQSAKVVAVKLEKGGGAEAWQQDAA